MFSIMEQLGGIVRSNDAKSCPVALRRNSTANTDTIVLQIIADFPGRTTEEIHADPRISLSIFGVQDSLRKLRLSNRLIAVRRLAHEPVRFWPNGMQAEADAWKNTILEGSRKWRALTLMSDGKWRSNRDIQLATGWCSQDISQLFNDLLREGYVTWKKNPIRRIEKLWRVERTHIADAS